MRERSRDASQGAEEGGAREGRSGRRRDVSNESTVKASRRRSERKGKESCRGSREPSFESMLRTRRDEVVSEVHAYTAPRATLDKSEGW